MMPNVWFISDTHFNHANILTFQKSDGTKERPEFSSVEEMNEHMIERWNSAIKPNEKVYHLGDVGFNQNELDKILPRLNGKKRLILGNHDCYPMSFYTRHFQKIAVQWRPTSTIIFSHYPLLLSADHPKLRANVHGHIHNSHVNDNRYMNVSVEVIDYTPIHFDTIFEHFKNLGIDV